MTRFQKVIKLQSFELSISDAIPANVQNISLLVFFASFVRLMENKVYWCFCPFLRTYLVPKFWIIKSYLDISDVIHSNEHSKYAFKKICFKKFGSFVNVILFYDENDHFKAPSKCENLSSCSTKLTHFQKTTTCIGLQADQIFSVSI